MMKRVECISIRSVVPVSAAISFILGCFTVASTYWMASLAPGRITSFELKGPISLSFSSVPDLYVLLLYPFLSAIAGAVGAVLLAVIYNFLARFVGPVRVRLSD